MNELETFVGPNGLPTQLFNGKVYQLFPSDPRYFKRGNNIRLHVEVWTFYNGRPPKKYHVHHLDENKHNNLPNNLELKKAGDHMRDHTIKRMKQNPEWIINLAKSGQDGAAKWSKTPEGRLFRQDHAKKVLFKYHDHLHTKTAEKVCEICDKTYLTTNLRATKSRFCSNNCKSTFRRRSGVDNIEKPCLTCGNMFTVNKYSVQKHCSRACGQKNIAKE